MFDYKNTFLKIPDTLAAAAEGDTRKSFKLGMLTEHLAKHEATGGWRTPKNKPYTLLPTTHLNNKKKAALKTALEAGGFTVKETQKSTWGYSTIIVSDPAGKPLSPETIYNYVNEHFSTPAKDRVTALSESVPKPPKPPEAKPSKPATTAKAAPWWATGRSRPAMTARPTTTACGSEGDIKRKSC